jgi:peptidoglycan L-alanyl-D-glutamate endopeptidase CwlK
MKPSILQQLAELTRQLLRLQSQLPPKGLLPLVARKRDMLIALAEQRGTPIRVVSGFRSSKEQDDLYAQGRTKPGNIVTQAKGGQSFHNYGIAFDVCFKSPPASHPYNGNDWYALEKLGNSIGLEHGDRGYVDLPHFQLRLGYSLEDFQKGRVDYSKYR